MGPWPPARRFFGASPIAHLNGFREIAEELNHRDVEAPFVDGRDQVLAVASARRNVDAERTNIGIRLRVVASGSTGFGCTRTFRVVVSGVFAMSGLPVTNNTKARR